MLVLNETISSSGKVTIEDVILNFSLDFRVIPFLRHDKVAEGYPDTLHLRVSVPPAIPCGETLTSSNLGLTIVT